MTDIILTLFAIEKGETVFSFLKKIEVDVRTISRTLKMNSKMTPKMDLKEWEFYMILFIAILGGLDIIVVIEAPAPLNDVSNGSTFYIYGNGRVQGKCIEGEMYVNDNFCNIVEHGRCRQIVEIQRVRRK